MASLSVSIIALVVAVAAVVVASVTSKRALKAGMTPVLVFTAPERGNIWILENVGGGPALNLVVYDRRSSEWEQAVRCNAMATGAAKDIPWVKDAKELAATYEDALGTHYVSLCQDHQTKIDVGTRSFKCIDSELKIERRVRREMNSPSIRVI